MHIYKLKHNLKHCISKWETRWTEELTKAVSSMIIIGTTKEYSKILTTKCPIYVKCKMIG